MWAAVWIVAYLIGLISGIVLCWAYARDEAAQRKRKEDVKKEVEKYLCEKQS